MLLCDGVVRRCSNHIDCFILNLIALGLIFFVCDMSTKQRRGSLTNLPACTVEILNRITAYLSDAQREELRQLYVDAWAAMPASKRAQSSAVKLREALYDAQSLLTAARTARANVNIAAGVQFDMSVFLSSTTEGRSDWVLLSWTAALTDVACLSAVLVMRPSQQCLNWPDKEGLTALHVAAKRSAIDATRLLLQAGANIAAASTGDKVAGQTAVHYAQGQKQCSGELMSLYIKYKANILQRDAIGFTPLHWCVPQFGCKYKLDAARVILQEMKKLGTDADFRVADTYSSSALAWCMLNAAKLLDTDMLPMVQLLLANGAKPHYSELILAGDTALQRAVKKGLSRCAAAMQQTVRAAAVTQQTGDNSGSSSSSSSSSSSGSSSRSSIYTNSSSSSSSSNSSSSTSRAANRPIAQTAPEVLDLLDSNNYNYTDDDMVVEAPVAAVNNQIAASKIPSVSAVQAVQPFTTAAASDNTSADTVHTGADDDETESECEHGHNCVCGGKASGRFSSSSSSSGCSKGSSSSKANRHTAAAAGGSAKANGHSAGSNTGHSSSSNSRKSSNGGSNGGGSSSSKGRSSKGRSGKASTSNSSGSSGGSNSSNSSTNSSSSVASSTRQTLRL
jgi:Ankyrin repeats (many copies)